LTPAFTSDGLPVFGGANRSIAGGKVRMAGSVVSAQGHCPTQRHYWAPRERNYLKQL
jgi:hypothetical protein